MTDELRIELLSIDECKRVCRELQIQLSEDCQSSTNGDDFETWLCNWQKTQK